MKKVSQSMDVLQPTPIVVITPKTQEDFQKVSTFVRLLCSFSNLELPSHVLYYALQQTVGTFCLFFSAGVPIAWFAWDEHKTSAELHAVIRPDLNKLFGRVNATVLRAHLVEMALDEMLVVRDKYKVFFKASVDNRAIRLFAKRYGFDRLKNLDKGRAVYRLSQEEWLKRRVKEAEGSRIDNSVSVDQELSVSE